MFDFFKRNKKNDENKDANKNLLEETKPNGKIGVIKAQKKTDSKVTEKEVVVNGFKLEYNDNLKCYTPEISYENLYSDSAWDVKKEGVEYHVTERGLYPDDILVLSMATKFKVNGKISDNLGFRYGQLDLKKILVGLKKKGCIEFGGIKETLMKLTAKDLKEILTKYGLKTTGTKLAMVNEIVDNVDNATLESTYPDKYYKMTDIGEEELKNNEYVTYLAKTGYCGIWEMNHLLYFENPKHLKYRDVLWGYLNRKSLDNFAKHDFNSYRFDHFNMYEFLMEEKRYDTAFQRLAEVVYMDLSGLRMDGKYMFKDKPYFYKMLLRSTFPYYNEETGQYSNSTVAPSVSKLLAGIKEKLSIESDEEFYNMLLREFKGIEERYPFQIFTAEECALLCIYEMNGNKDKVIDIYKFGEKRVKVMSKK